MIAVAGRRFDGGRGRHVHALDTKVEPGDRTICGVGVLSYFTTEGDEYQHISFEDFVTFGTWKFCPECLRLIGKCDA